MIDGFLTGRFYFSRDCRLSLESDVLSKSEALAPAVSRRAREEIRKRKFIRARKQGSNEPLIKLF